MLRKGVYTYEYMDDWESRNEILIPEKEDFYTHLNMEDITDADYGPAKRENLEEHHDFHVKWDTLLLADAFESLINMCLEIYELDPAKFLSAPGLAWQAALIKGKSKITSFNWYWYVINGRKGKRGEICHTINWYAKDNNNYIKNCDKNK